MCAIDISNLVVIGGAQCQLTEAPDKSAHPQYHVSQK